MFSGNEILCYPALGSLWLPLRSTYVNPSIMKFGVKSLHGIYLTLRWSSVLLEQIIFWYILLAQDLGKFVSSCLWFLKGVKIIRCYDLSATKCSSKVKFSVRVWNSPTNRVVSCMQVFSCVFQFFWILKDEFIENSYPPEQDFSKPYICQT